MLLINSKLLYQIKIFADTSVLYVFCLTGVAFQIELNSYKIKRLGEVYNLCFSPQRTDVTTQDTKVLCAVKRGLYHLLPSEFVESN